MAGMIGISAVLDAQSTIECAVSVSGRQITSNNRVRVCSGEREKIRQINSHGAIIIFLIHNINL